MARTPGVVQLEILPLLLNARLSVDRLIGDGRSLAAAEVDEVPRPSVSPPPVPKHFAGYDDPSILGGDPEKIRGQASTTLPKLDRDPDRSLAIARNQLPKSAPPRHGGRNVVGQGVLEEHEDVEQGRLSRPVGADEDGELGEILELHTAEHAVVFYLDVLDAHPSALGLKDLGSHGFCHPESFACTSGAFASPVA